MRFLQQLFGQNDASPGDGADGADPVIPVPIPPLVYLLDHLEREKGSPLTETEVWEARDSAICMTMRTSERDRIAQHRGYVDIDMENAWAEWQAVQHSLRDSPE